MQLLNGAGHFSGGNDAVVSELLGLPSVAPGEYDGFYAPSLALLQCLQNVGGLA